jgi:hypothetical protein
MAPDGACFLQTFSPSVFFHRSLVVRLICAASVLAFVRWLAPMTSFVFVFTFTHFLTANEELRDER